MTFAKVTGPAWLGIAGNGALSGTPLSPDVGTNSFVVRVTDSGSLTNFTTVNIAVIAAPPITASIMPQGGNLLLSWSGGLAPYQIQMTTNLPATLWLNVGGATIATSSLISPTNTAGFYRILGQ
jgi:hypothetical protein